MNDRLRLTFPKEQISQPLLCNVAREFSDITYSIRRADVRADSAWIDIEIEGESAVVETVISYIQENGVRVDPIEGDIVAG